MPLTIGYHSIISLADFDVDAVYTGQAFQPTVAEILQSPSVDVERVLARRLSTAAAAAFRSALRESR